jgi:hypothetical protein
MSAEDGSLHLSIPGWFPKPLEERARKLYASAVHSSSPEDRATVQRLVGDPRMKAVWAELRKCRRADGAFVHEAEALVRAVPAKQGSLLNEVVFRKILQAYTRSNRAKKNQRTLRELKRAWELNPDPRKIPDLEEAIAAARSDVDPEIVDQAGVEASRYQFAAMEVVFRKAVLLGRDFGSLHFGTATRHSYLEQASRARSEALSLERVGRHHIKDQKHGRALRQCGKKLQNSLNKTAERYKAYANLLADSHLDRTASIEFVRQMAGTLKDVFGKRLNSTVATIASVALDREITRANVKDWVKRSSKTRSPSGQNRPKSHRFHP